MGFEKWDSELHSNLNQIKRIAASQKIPESKILRFEPDDELCIMQGSSGETYMVSLEHCDCRDFDSRRLPCKHMYWLAKHLGYLSVPQLDEEKAKSFNVNAEIDRFYDLYTAGIISAEKYVKIAEAIKK